MAREEKTISKNKKAFHEFFIEDRYEAGLVLTGVEVKSLRENGASLRECFALVRANEAWLHGLHISPYSHGNRENIDLDRPRKLLLHRQEIRELSGELKQKGFALIPLRIYFNTDNRAKVELGLAKGKKLHDKRASIAEKDMNRDAARDLRERNKGQ